MSGFAESAINRAGVLLTEGTDPQLRLRYKVSYVRVLDSKRKFIDAAAR